MQAEPIDQHMVQLLQATRPVSDVRKDFPQPPPCSPAQLGWNRIRSVDRELDLHSWSSCEIEVHFAAVRLSFPIAPFGNRPAAQV